MENRRVLRVDSAKFSVFLGNSVGVKNAGVANTGVGNYALANNTSGSDNTAVGYTALNSNTQGYSNTATGSFALSINSTGTHNTANGHYALYLNSTGSGDTATGYSALYNNTTGSQNVASGQGALGNNTTGGNNTAVGASALFSNTTASDNTAIGYNALANSPTGNRNVAVGNHALIFNNGAWNNTAVGDYAGATFLHGWNNTFIGSQADATFGGAYNTVALGHYAKVTAPNQVRIGNASTTSIGGYTNWTNISDGRVKRNIQENVPGLAFINKLKPITYNLDLDVADKIIATPAEKGKDGKSLAKPLTQADIAARQAKQQVVYTGFVAQDVEKAAKELNYNFSGVDAAKSDRDLYGLRYTDFIMPMVKALQELSKENDELKSQLEKLEAAVNGKQPVSTSFQAAKIADAAADALLQQNAPNPFNQNTIIRYQVPKSAGTAVINITDVNGKLIKTVTTLAKGAGQLVIEGGQMASGTYHYTLVVDGKVVETKKMVLQK
jgi:hypothetical protein